MKEDINIIRNEWFKDHKAYITKLSDRVTVVDWKREDSGFYSVRYVFDGDKLYISGDIGTAVYWLTWFGTPESFKNVHFSYFNEKCQCSLRSAFEYYSEVFDKDVKDYLSSDWVEDLTKEQMTKYKKLFCEIKSEMERYPNSPQIQEYLMFMTAERSEYADELGIDTEVADYLSRFGRAPSTSHLAYLEGLKMIAEQEVVAVH